MRHRVRRLIEPGLLLASGILLVAGIFDRTHWLTTIAVVLLVVAVSIQYRRTR